MSNGAMLNMRTTNYLNELSSSISTANFSTHPQKFMSAKAAVGKAARAAVGGAKAPAAGAAGGAGGGKKLNKTIRVTVPAQAATMQGLGAQLGQHGFKVIDFCQQFNKQTAHIAKDTRIPCEIRLFKDRSFEFDMKAPMTSHLIKMAAGDTKTLTLRDCYNIALIKTGGSQVYLKQITKSIPGSAKTMGIKVEGF
jgi:large subunit ribosomal protein L11